MRRPHPTRPLSRRLRDVERTALLAALALLAAAAPRPAVAADGSRAAIAAAESLFAAGRLDAAERAFEPLEVRGPADSLVALRRAALDLYRNDLTGALRELDRIELLVPRLRSAERLRAEALVRAGDCVRAAAVYERLGRSAMAASLRSVRQRYRVDGPDTCDVPLVQVDPLPIVEARVDGSGPLYFLIDTGAGDVILDPEVADSLRLPRFGEETGTFGGGRTRSFVHSRIGALTIGDRIVRDVPAQLLDTRRFAAVGGGRRIAGVLGTGMFMHLRATLDYPAGRLELDRPDAPGRTRDTTGTERVTVPFRLAGDHLILADGRLGDGPVASWLVDTGLAGAGVAAPAAALREAGIPVPDTAGSVTGQGGGGAVRVQVFGVPSFALGDAVSGGLMGVYGAFPESLEHGQGHRIAGIISHTFFRPWRVTFDFRAMQLVMVRPRD